MFLDFLNETSKPQKIVKFLGGVRKIKFTCTDGYKWNPTIRRCERIEPTTLRKREKSMKIRLSRMGDN